MTGDSTVDMTQVKIWSNNGYETKRRFNIASTAKSDIRIKLTAGLQEGYWMSQDCNELGKKVSRKEKTLMGKVDD